MAKACNARRNRSALDEERNPFECADPLATVPVIASDGVVLPKRATLSHPLALPEDPGVSDQISTLKPTSTSLAGMPPLTPQFSIGGSWSTTSTSLAGTSSATSRRTIAS